MKKQIKTNYKIGGIILLILVMAIIFPTISKANLQSRPVEEALSKKASQFFLLCRQMETSGGPLGLSAEISTAEDKVTEITSPNGIDVHMIKNTEWGTAAMLSASVYGDCPVGRSFSVVNDTTTRK